MQCVYLSAIGNSTISSVVVAVVFLFLLQVEVLLLYTNIVLLAGQFYNVRTIFWHQIRILQLSRRKQEIEKLI
jgi:hypothetical protein